MVLQVGLDAKALVDAFAAVQKLVPLPVIFFSADAGESPQMQYFELLPCVLDAHLCPTSHSRLRGQPCPAYHMLHRVDGRL